MTTDLQRFRRDEYIIQGAFTVIVRHDEIEIVNQITDRRVLLIEGDNIEVEEWWGFGAKEG